MTSIKWAASSRSLIRCSLSARFTINTMATIAEKTVTTTAKTNSQKYAGGKKGAGAANVAAAWAINMMFLQVANRLALTNSLPSRRYWTASGESNQTASRD